jgi:hypothetical protein
VDSSTEVNLCLPIVCVVPKLKVLASLFRSDTDGKVAWLTGTEG